MSDAAPGLPTATTSTSVGKGGAKMSGMTGGGVGLFAGALAGD